MIRIDKNAFSSVIRIGVAVIFLAGFALGALTEWVISNV